MMEAALLWDKCLDDLKYQVKPTVFTMWLRPLSAQVDGETFIIRAPNNYFVDYVQKNHLQAIEQLVIKHSAEQIKQVIVRVDNVSSASAESEAQADSPFADTTNNTFANEMHTSAPTSTYASSTSPTSTMAAGVDPTASGQISSADAKSLSYLNADFTFDTFVTGKTNNLAYKACYELTKRQSQNRHNPLFIYGPSGLGKTHLMHSVAHRYLKQNRSFIISLLKNFINQLVLFFKK